MIISREERKLDRLKMNPRGATKGAPICVLPMHHHLRGADSPE